METIMLQSGPHGDGWKAARADVDHGGRVPFVVAMVLNWNNLPDTLECLDSLQRSDWTNLAVWVVDNHSLPDPTTLLREKHPMVRVLRNPDNMGYGGGHNPALRQAIAEGATYALLLNNDVVVAPETVRRLVMAAEADARIAMATPRVFYYDRPTEVYWDGGTIDWETGETWHQSAGLPVEGGVLKSEWLDGCALLVRISAIRDIGFLEERYFLYFEDTDWSIRALRRGWTNAVVLGAEVWHKVSRSTGGLANPAVRFYYARNRYFFLRLHSPVAKGFMWKVRYARTMLREYRLVGPAPEAREAIVAACFSLLRGRGGAYKPSRARRRFLRVLDSVSSVVRAVRGRVRRGYRA